MLARFSVAYERFCRLLVAIFVVNVAILAHTLMGAVVLGFLPSFAAAQATFRAWVLSEDRSMRAKEVWKTFHGFWKSEVKRANLFRLAFVILWAVVIVDYCVMNWHARGDFDIMVSGVLLLIIVVLAVFSSFGLGGARELGREFRLGCSYNTGDDWMHAPLCSLCRLDC